MSSVPQPGGGEMKRRLPRYEANTVEELDDRLMRDGYTAFLDQCEAEGSLEDWIAQTGSSVMLAAFSREMAKRRQSGAER